MLKYTKNPQGCGFGALESLYCAMARFVSNPRNGARFCAIYYVNTPGRICRGAVGYITGAFAPKADGNIAICFSNTPTACLWRFYLWGKK